MDCGRKPTAVESRSLKGLVARAIGEITLYVVFRKIPRHAASQTGACIGNASMELRVRYDLDPANLNGKARDQTAQAVSPFCQ